MDKITMIRARHNLVWAERSGLDYAVKSLDYGPRKEAGQQLIYSGIPAIVRRQENPRDDVIEVGFSSHEYIDGARFRIAAEIPAESVTRVVRPHEVPILFDYSGHPRAPVLDRLFARAKDLGFIMGIYGSTALQIVTGLPYSRPDSDIDIFLSRPTDGNLRDFYDYLCRFQEQNQVKLDVELDIGEGYAVKLAEMFSGQKTVLAKGYDGVELFRIRDIVLSS